MLAPPPPMIHTFGLGKGVLGGGGGLQTPDFQKKSGVPGPRTPDSRFPEKIWSTPRLQTPDSRFPYPQTPDSRFPEKIWSTSRLQTPDFQKNLEYRDSGLQILESGVWGREHSRFFLEIWSLESGAPVLQTFSGNLESGVRGPGTPDFFWKSGVWSPGPGTPDFFWKSGVWSPGPGYSRFFLEIWSLESGPGYSVRGAGTPDFFWKSGVWSPGPGTPDFFWKSGVWSPGRGYSRFFLEI